MTLYAARRDTRSFEALAAGPRSPLDVDRTEGNADAERQRPQAPCRRTTTSARRVTRLLPTGLW